MAEYAYGWDNVNQKKRYMGKYPEVNPSGQGYYGSNDAGVKRKFVGAEAGTKREFIGSRTTEYTFYNEAHGTHTIAAESYEEALRIAESLGYTRGDYRKRRRGR